MSNTHSATGGDYIGNVLGEEVENLLQDSQQKDVLISLFQETLRTVCALAEEAYSYYTIGDVRKAGDILLRLSGKSVEGCLLNTPIM